PFGKKAKNLVFGKNIKGRTFQEGVTTDFYEVVERSRIQGVLKEQDFSNSGMVDPEQAAQLGKVLGVDAVIFGTGEVSAHNRYQATATLSMRIVDTNTAKILGQKVITKITRLSSEAPSTEAVREKAIEEAANEAVMYFTPFFSLQKINFQQLKRKEYKADSKKAIKFLGRGELHKSLAIYTSIVDRDPYNHKAVYMQGVVYELASNYDKALERYNMAYQVFDESDQYHEAIVRTESQQNLWKILNRNGVRMNIKNLLLSKREVEDAGKRKIRIKGNSKTRVPVYDSPGKGTILMKIPGGLSMPLIDRESDFYKVKLITGEEGYIHVKDAR
ncbi:MAG: hypothetical protein GY950_08740, partial [bacterium]|nr:hypothetical protein [bacterium]